MGSCKQHKINRKKLICCEMSVSFSIDKFKVNSAFDIKSELFFVTVEISSRRKGCTGAVCRLSSSEITVAHHLLLIKLYLLCKL